MIKANELRIGNFVFGVSDRIEIIREIHFKGGVYTCPVKMNSDFKSNIEDLSGIQLSSEILDKCGFHEGSIGHNDTAFVLKADWREQPSFHFYIEYTDSPFGNDKDMLYPIAHEIKYLHQLQNLHFALTHEELNIEL